MVDMPNHRIKKALSWLGALYLTGAVFFKLTESLSWIDSFYFTAVTMTTLGYGDITPTTSLSKIFLVFFSFGSIMLLFYIVGLMVEGVFHKSRGKKLKVGSEMKE